MKKEFRLEYEEYASDRELAAADAELLRAAARLVNGAVITGSNQENASFPAGICAERTLLSAAASRFPGVAIETLAISYSNEQGSSDRPISPCGICRQSLQEMEHRTGHPIRLVLGGMEGKVFVLPEAGQLLPLAFTPEELG
jgi:cytidine deaminase